MGRKLFRIIGFTFLFSFAAFSLAGTIGLIDLHPKISSAEDSRIKQSQFKSGYSVRVLVSEIVTVKNPEPIKNRYTKSLFKYDEHCKLYTEDETAKLTVIAEAEEHVLARYSTNATVPHGLDRHPDSMWGATEYCPNDTIIFPTKYEFERMVENQQKAEKEAADQKRYDQNAVAAHEAKKNLIRQLLKNEVKR